MRRFLVPLLLILTINLSANSLLKHEKKRVVVLTDISNEPDDEQSLVRFLLYSNMFDIEGVIATTSYWLPDQTKELEIMRIMRAYGKVYENLKKHEDGFPTVNELLNQSKTGLPVYGMHGLGFYSNSEGSMSILNSLKKDDDRPLWVLIWGGSNCLAQALWQLDFGTTDAEFDSITSRLRVYAISDQDETGPWIRNTYPNIFYICSPGYNHDGQNGYMHATWEGISGERMGHNQGFANSSLVSDEWIKTNIQTNHGALGEAYPDVKYLMEGDTPSLLYLIENGLGDPDNPDYGSWGGRYEYYTPSKQSWFFIAEGRPFWTNATDVVYNPENKQNYQSNQATIWRWREEFQNDFAARMDWCVKSFDDANHPPVPVLDMPEEITVEPGSKVELKAGDATDPDNDQLTYEWMYYPEAGTSDANFKLESSLGKVVNFIAPTLSYPNTMHFILKVTDDGEPKLTRYKRVVVNVQEIHYKPRTIILTDGEVDDKSSFVRYLMYSNEFETEGLIYSNSVWQPKGNGLIWMNKAIDLYAKYQANLAKNDPDYPAADKLKSVIYDGNRSPYFLNSHEPIKTLGAQHIINVLMDKDPRPIWFQVWGGTNTIAQALSILERDYKKEDLKYALNKMRIFAIADQDSTSDWIRSRYPDLMYIRSHQFVALNYQHEGHLFSNADFFTEDWMTQNVKTNHGELGASYPQSYFSEGDSPAFFHLIGNGLRADEDPTYGGWGGRFESNNGFQYYDASDDGDFKKPQWRWLYDIQNDFAARMNWCVNDYEHANHYPEIKLNVDSDIKSKPGAKITFDASASSDPDGNKLQFEWYFYADASSVSEMPKLNSNRSSKFSFHIPDGIEKGTIHLILEVTDDGLPAMKKYKRVIINVEP